MSVPMVGGDADELERIAATLRSVADELDGHAGSVTSALRSVAWVGGVATRFGSTWHGDHRPRVAATAQYVRDAARRLDRNADEQRRASRVEPGGTCGAGHSASSNPSNPSNQAGSITDRPPDGDRLEQLLDGFGLAREQIEIVVDLAGRLREHGEVGELIDVLTGDAVATLLSAADHVLDAGIAIVDAVTDFADHPGLAFDDRIVHALADTAVRFGLSEGMEFAAEWLAGATAAALLPGFGAVLAPFVGDIAGVVAGRLMDVTIDAIDDATDVVDTIADAVVAAYQDVKDVVGLVADVAEAATAVVGGAFDLAGDAAGVAVDVGGVLVGAGADLVGGLVGALDPFD